LKGVVGFGLEEPIFVFETSSIHILS